MKILLAALFAAVTAYPQIAGLDEAMNAAIQAGQMPGAVLLVGQDGKTLHYRAYGQRSLVPQTWRVHQSFLPAGMPGALTDLPFQQDVARAKALLAEAGLPDGFDLVLDHPAIPPYAEIAQALQANLAAVGIRLKLLAGDQRQIITKTRARQHQAALLYWGSDYFDPNSNAQAFCVNPDNADDAKLRTVAWRNNWRDAALSTAAAANAREGDAAKRLDEYRRLQRDAQQSDPFVILLQQVEVAVTRPGVAGFHLAGLAGRTDYAAVTKGA